MSRISWGAIDSTKRIAPGATLTAFSYNSSSPPSVGDYYSTGWIDIPIFPEGVEPDSIIGGTFPENSIKGRTLIPKTPPAPFNNLNFIDTIKSYINQSRTLGWISDDPTKNKYLTFMDSARAQLVRNDIRKTRTSLDSVTANAQRDSSTALTSEAYALIFFNAKFLLAQLPLPPSQFSLTVNTPVNGSVSKNPSLSLYDSATTVTLTAVADSHYHFVNWSGGKTGTTNPDTVRMTSNRTVTANFAINTDTITTTVVGSGTISPNGATVVNYGSNQRFTYSASTNYRLDSVIVDGIKKDSTVGYTFYNVIANHTIKVKFKRTYQIIVQTSPTARRFTVDGITDSTARTYTWDSSSTHSLVVPDPQTVGIGVQYKWTSWSDTLGNPHNVTATANKTYTANFRKQYNDTVWTNPFGPSFTVDGTSYTTQQTAWWDSASSHTIATTSPQTSTSGGQYTWTSWSDLLAISHSVTATTTRSYTANFNYTVTSPLSSSWNMISVPVVVSDFRKTTLYSAATSPAYAYDLSYTAIETLKNGRGYWVKFSSPQSVSYTGLKIVSDTLDLATGWNLIGSVSDAFNDSLKVGGDSIIISPYYEYSTARGYFDSDTIRPGKAYWAKTSHAGTIILNKIDTASQLIIVPDQPPPPPGAPSTPWLVSPTNGATGVSTTPTMSWNTSEEATTYRLQVSSNSGFTTIVYDNANITITSQQVGGLGYSTTYYWRVSASNQFGTSNWQSILRSFTTQAAPPPPCSCCITSATMLDQFIVTDANGNAQAMYVRNSKRPLKMGFTDAEMPPKPLAGMFNARFKSNKFIESAAVGKSTRFQIDVGDAQGAVTLRWNLRAENNITYSVTRTGQPKATLTGNGSMEMAISGNGTITITAQAAPLPCAE